MSGLWPYAVAPLATLPTTLAVLALWVIHARVVDGNRIDSVLVPMIFLFVPLIFFVSLAANLGGTAIGHLAGAVLPMARPGVTIAAAGTLVGALCAWTQRGTFGWGRQSAPVSVGPVMLFALADMLILAGSLSLLRSPPLT